MEINELSKKYKVRKLSLEDVEEVFELCSRNSLYYQYCPPMVTPESIKADMKALPPGKHDEDVYYIGYYEENRLIAVADCVLGYPDEETIYIGFFMVDIMLQGQGIGSAIVNEMCEYFKGKGYNRMELAWVKGNMQAEQFWIKNDFCSIGERTSNVSEIVVAADRAL